LTLRQASFSVTPQEWREIWSRLNMAIHVGTHENTETWITRHWWQNAAKPEIMISFDLPLPEVDGIKDIVFSGAGRESAAAQQFHSRGMPPDQTD
jgi:hypothetical protein